jgi:hypothetical protein
MTGCFPPKAAVRPKSGSGLPFLYDLKLTAKFVVPDEAANMRSDCNRGVRVQVADLTRQPAGVTLSAASKCRS